MVTGIISILVAVVVGFIAYKALMGIIRIGVMIAIIGVLGYLYSTGAFG
jgi:hypothetical protein